MLFPPSLETQVVDGGTKREEEEAMCDAKCGEDEGTGGVAKQVRTDKGAAG